MVRSPHCFVHMDLSIIIVSFNVKELLQACLKSLEQEVEKTKSLKIEVIVIDNASGDGSVEYLQDRVAPSQNQGLKIKAFFNQENLGFARAVNQGIKIAKGEYLLLLNPDVVVKPGALLAMVNFAQTYPLAGVVGGRLLDPNGRLQGSCYRLPGIKLAIKEWWLGKRGLTAKYAPRGDKPVEVEVVTGAAMLIPKKVIEKIGLLDERYFMYFEDLDFCRRVKKAGFKVYYLPWAEIIHHHGASGKKIPKRTQQWLIESSKIYHGLLKHYLINFIIWSNQKWRKLF